MDDFSQHKVSMSIGKQRRELAKAPPKPVNPPGKPKARVNAALKVAVPPLLMTGRIQVNGN